MAAKYMMGNVCQVTMLKMRTKFSDRLDDGSMPSRMEKETMRHMCTLIEGNGMMEMTHKHTVGGGFAELGAPIILIINYSARASIPKGRRMLNTRITKCPPYILIQTSPSWTSQLKLA